MTMPSPEELQDMTPMVRQFFELKARVPDAILFFRMGDFYEIFGDDAEQVAPILDIVLTSRERGDKARLPFCGVPHHSARAYWLKLLRLGYRVAIADQLEDPAEAKGLVRRDIVQVMTPGCIEDLEGLEADQPNHLLVVYERPLDASWVIAVLDSSTGSFRLGAIAKEEFLAWVERLQPKEIVVRRFMLEEVQAAVAAYQTGQSLSFGTLPEAPLRDLELQKSLLLEHFAESDLALLPCGAVAGAPELVAAILVYLRGLHASTRQFLTIKPLHESDRMLLDETVRRDLELFETSRRRETTGSLFKEINATRTPMGARLLRFDLSQPFLDRERIQRRLDAVQALLEKPLDELRALQDQLRACADLDRLTTRVLSRKAQPPDVLLIQRALEASLVLQGLLTPGSATVLDDLSQGFEAAKAPLALLQDALNQEPVALGSLEVFRPGFSPAFDRLRALSREGSEQILAYEQKLRSETGISSLKIKEHKSYGLLIEITKANLTKVPSHFIRRQTMVNNERFVTMELEELGESLASATEEATRQEAELFASLLDRLTLHQHQLRTVAEALALLDVLQSFASKARQSHLVRPQLAKQGEVVLRGCRHLVVERFVGAHAFMPNDVQLNRQKKQLLITGPNMAGKSTVMRQTALAAILHQIGAFVPALEAVLPIFDRVFTRVGAADDLSRGQSTFMVEMAEAAHILRHATEKSLVILDEVGRGTSTQDGLAIAAAILDYISKKLRCYTLFATHYHELVPYSSRLSSTRQVQVEVVEEVHGIRFTHRLIAGASGSSFGVEVAKLAGIPEPIIAVAKHYLDHPEALGHAAPLAPSKAELRSSPVPPLEAAFVPEESDPRRSHHHAIQTIVERLERLNVLKTTPMQALAILDELKGCLDQTAHGPLFPETSHLC